MFGSQGRKAADGGSSKLSALGRFCTALTFAITAGTSQFVSPALAANSEILTAPSNDYTASNEYSVNMPTSDGENISPRDLQPDLQGWDHLYRLLLSEGADPNRLQSVLSDPRMPRYEPLYFSLAPREKTSLYRKHNTKAARVNAVRFYAENESLFRGAQKRFGVPKSVVLALLQVETGCGAFTGRDRVFFRLARLAAAASPDNINRNFARKSRAVKFLKLDDVRQRARTLQGLFLKHTAATLDVAQDLSLDTLDLRGSSAGAIGLPQFLPGNVALYGFDGDNNGQINLYDPADAIYSVARFLKEHGWNQQKSLTAGDKRAVLRNYNRSEPYVSTVLALSQNLERDISSRERIDSSTR